MRRLMYATALLTGLGVAGTTLAQPGPGGPGRGRREGPPEVQRLRAEVEKLTSQVKELQDKLAKTRAEGPKDRPAPKGEGPKDRPAPKDRAAAQDDERPGDRGPGRRGPGFGGPRGFGGGPGFGGPFGRGPGGFGPRGTGSGFRGPRDRGPGAPPDTARRIERIIGELEQLKKDLQGDKR